MYRIWKRKYICSYPTYEEWKLWILCQILVISQSSYPTYEEWKPSLLLLVTFLCCFSVLILPMRNGNLPILKLVASLKLVLVLILPMRNGNSCVRFVSFTRGKSSYPTYEEWKHYFNSRFHLAFLLVLILPMRNGNYTSMTPNAIIADLRSYPTYEEWKLPIARGLYVIFASVFLSYLWGMETKF